MILLRHAARYCAETDKRRLNVESLLNTEIDLLEERNKERHEEIMDIHRKELGITMSKEGELLVKLRLLMVLRGFKQEWLVEKDILSRKDVDELISNLKKKSKKKKKEEKKDELSSPTKIDAT